MRIPSTTFRRALRAIPTGGKPALRTILVLALFLPLFPAGTAAEEFKGENALLSRLSQEELVAYFVLHDSGGSLRLAIHDGRVTLGYGIHVTDIRHADQIYDHAVAAIGATREGEARAAPCQQHLRMQPSRARLGAVRGYVVHDSAWVPGCLYGVHIATPANYVRASAAANGHPVKRASPPATRPWVGRP